ncbi:hypothetical protein KIPB_009312, partial [Kipferlia bialata]|eukprot:g9312.t1
MLPTLDQLLSVGLKGGAFPFRHSVQPEGESEGQAEESDDSHTQYPHVRVGMGRGLPVGVDSERVSPPSALSGYVAKALVDIEGVVRESVQGEGPIPSHVPSTASKYFPDRHQRGVYAVDTNTLQYSRNMLFERLLEE